MTPTCSNTPKYRATLTGEVLAWAIFKTPASFSLVHPVQDDPERGPVILVGDDVFEVDDDDLVFATKAAALEAYYANAHPGKPIINEIAVDKSGVIYYDVITESEARSRIAMLLTTLRRN